nr:sensor domain-containing phosphodiesterase [Cohaesibacter intestini]
MFSFASLGGAGAVEAVDVKADSLVLDLSDVIERYDGDGDRIQVSTAPGPDGIVRRIEVRARQQGVIPGWFVFALANNTDRQIDRYLVIPHFRLPGSGLLKPDLGAQRVHAISTSQGFAPERIPDSEADVFRVTLDPGNVVTFVGEQAHRSLTSLNLWQPEAYKDYVNSYSFFRGIVLGIAGLLALFLVILFVVKGAAMFPAAALLAWSVLAYLAIDFGFMAQLFDIPTNYEPIWRAGSEVVFSASILVLLFTYLTLHRWHVRYLHASGIWLIFLVVILGLALYDPSLGAGIARLSMVVTALAGFAVILYLAFTGFDRAIMLIPTWILLLLWLLAAGAAVSGVVDNDLVQPALSGGMVLLVLLFCFTIMQHAFSGGILAQGIVSDSERRALAIVGSGDMVWDWDVPRDRIHTTREAEKLLGLKSGALDGPARDWLEMLHPQDKDRFSAMLDAVIDQRRGRVNQDFRLRADDGHYRWFKLRARPVVGTDGEVVRCVGTLLDITDQRTAETRLLHDAVHDNLTGLANRELLQDRLSAAMVRTQAEGAAKPAVLLVDIDNFRKINDSYGLSIGDSLLLTVARRLSRLLKPQDSIARFYGDQFAIILISEQQPERIAVFADNVRKVLKVPITFGEREIALSVSLGIAIFDLQSHKAAGEILSDSELALYHAKRMGGDRIEPFRPSLRQQGRGRSSLDKDLIAALDRKEIDVVFQPIVNLQDRMIKGFEALARWNHPQRGPIPPSDFIPAAERNGLIVPLGLHIMEQAARQLTEWQQKLDGADRLFMSVNVSSEQLLRHDLLNDVKTILSRSNVNPGTFKLELTESLVMENPEYASQVLDKLRGLGAGLSLDDFGTGYSSLAYLQHFPFDTLKIDKSFVGHGKGVTPVILQSIVKLAHDLGLNLVAEGVENEEAVAQLTQMGCPMGQGYLFGKPLVSADAESLLSRQIEHAKQVQAEAAARRKQQEAEAQARKAEEERRAREERRRKETEELERKQAYARSIAEQSLPKPDASKQPVKAAGPHPTDALEARLAEGLALDLTDKGPAKPKGAPVSGSHPSAHPAPRMQPVSGAHGSAIAPANAPRPPSAAQPNTAPVNPPVINPVPPKQPDMAKKAEQQDSAATPRENEGADKGQTEKSNTASGPQHRHGEPQQASGPVLPPLDAAAAVSKETQKTSTTEPELKGAHENTLEDAIGAAVAEAIGVDNLGTPPTVSDAEQAPVPPKQEEATSAKASVVALPPVATLNMPNFGSVAPQGTNAASKESAADGAVETVVQDRSPEQPAAESTPKPEPSEREEAAPRVNEDPSPDMDDAKQQQISSAAKDAKQDREADKGEETTQSEQSEQPQSPQPAPASPVVGRAVSAGRKPDTEQDGGLPFAMPDMSGIDQDIASAIRQAMIGGKKD